MASTEVKKVLIFSKGKPEMTFTGDWLKQHNAQDQPIWVLSEDDDRKGYQKSTGAPLKNIIIAKGCKTLAQKRQWALDFFHTQKNPWVFWMEDNIQRITCVNPTNYGRTHIDQTSRSMYHDYHLTYTGLMKRVAQDIVEADRYGIRYGGFASNDNHFFRKPKYRTIAFVWTKMAYFRADQRNDWRIGDSADLTPHGVMEKDDYLNTAEQLFRYSGTLVNNFIYPWPKKYEGRGGSRTLEERFEDKITACKHIMRCYPGLFRFKKKAGTPHGAEIQLASTHPRTLAEWRDKMWDEYLKIAGRSGVINPLV